jgi:hypothetical protein
LSTTKPVTTIFFSKDRALQLDAAIRSFHASCRDSSVSRQSVIYACSDENHEKQYRALKKVYPMVRFVREENFLQDLLSILSGNPCTRSPHLLFLVDDNVFVRSWSIKNVTAYLESEKDSAIGLSLRLGRNTTFCYSLNKEQEIPPFAEVSPEIMKFKWTEAACDFAYPLEVSSSVYRTEQILPLLLSEAGEVTNPNTLEVFLHEKRRFFAESHPFLLCFNRSVTFCNAINVVQSSFFNRSSNDPHYLAPELLRRFRLGYRIDLHSFSGFEPKACHQVVPFKYMVPRAGNVTIAASVEVSDNRDKEAADNGAAEAGDGQINRSCKLSIADTDERDHYPLFELLELLEGASGKDEPWLLVLARLIQENRLSDISKVARQIESIESQNSDLKSRLQHFEDWISELTKTKDWLQEHWSNWMRVAEEQKKRIEELEQQLKTKERTVEDPPDKTNK